MRVVADDSKRQEPGLVDFAYHVGVFQNSSTL
jgi:hypothetical protein